MNPTPTHQNGAPPQALAQVPQPQPPAAAATVEYQGGNVVRVGFETLAGFEALQRIGKAFAVSSLVPDAYAGNLANCVIAIEMAARMRASPLMVMQNLYLVHGRPSWSAQFAIASFNECGRFTALKYRWFGERGTPTWGCAAYCKEKETGELVEGPEITIALAQAEGWIDRKGSKWKTLPQLMLTYRAATFLIRTTAPELLMGLRTAEEQEDIGGPEAEAFNAPPLAGVQGLKAIVAATPAPTAEPAKSDPAAPAQKAAEEKPTAKVEEPLPHDPQTGEVREPGADDGEAVDDGARELLDIDQSITAVSSVEIASEAAKSLEAIQKRLEKLPDTPARKALVEKLGKAWQPVLQAKGREVPASKRK